jgi:hypothetical protein
MSKAATHWRAALGLALTWGIAGCAPKQHTAPVESGPPPAQQPEPGPPPQPAADSELDRGGGAIQSSPSAPADEGADSDDLQYAEPPASAPAVEPTPLPAGPEVRDAIDREWLVLEREETRLSDALGDCARACRALDSMQRSARHICQLEPPPGRGRCEDAKDRVQQARRRVHRACGECQGRE